MRSEIYELIADFKAAVRIGHPDSLAVALEGFYVLPEVAGNAVLSEAFIHQAILPLGEVLAFPGLELKQLKTLLADPSAGVRALGAVALGLRYLKQLQVDAAELTRPGSDARRDVRQALGEALDRHAQLDPRRLLALLETWLSVRTKVVQSARLRYTGLVAIPGLIPAYGDQAMVLLAAQPLESDTDTRRAYVDALIYYAQNGYEEQVYDLLANWSEKTEPDTWIITKTLSAGWAAVNPERSETILRALEEQAAGDQAIERARRALARHRDVQ
jgi:hypothetical protein